ncbi:MAG: hypothetical protein ACE5I7_17610 [Candidatus Binatia bacterium]
MPAAVSRALRRLAALAAIQLILATAAAALITGGGGSASTDCLLVFDAAANVPTAKPRHVRCVDGDSACDADGLVNGSCEIPVAVCANSTALSKCTLAGVKSITVQHALDNGDKKFDPQFQALQAEIDNAIQAPTADNDVCTSPMSFRVLIKGPLGKNRCRRQTKKVKITTVSQLIGGKFFTDKDTIKLTCKPAPDNGCDPQALFSSTFDRIQTQIFNQNCAVSGCHDSQSRTGNLLLETGAARTNLVNVTPDNQAALQAGWKRVTVLRSTSGDPDLSLLYRKVAGDLPDASFGVRMPKDKRKLHKTLREIIRLWIENGAPETGWVPGTF